MYKIKNEVFSRQKWIEEDCVFTYSCNCDMCPYVIYDENGSRKCEKDMYDKCTNKG